MPTETIENYLKQIYLLEQKEDGGLVSMGRIAEAMEVAPGTATAMVKRLAGSRHLLYEPYSGVRLSAKGRDVALLVLRRHRLIESFLVDTLGLDWSEVHEEAERLEHVISDRLLERIDNFLGRPKFDPHGDPIPDMEGRVREASLISLPACEPGARARVARVLDQNRRFLQFVDERGLRPGAEIELVSIDSVADSVTVRVDDHSVTMGRSAAAKLLVEMIGA
ncbi:MAG: metal-dependent transcriptional regulator [Phycisphaerales bacterium]